MEVTINTRTITIHTVELDEADVASLLEDPWEFAEQLRKRIQGNSNGAKPGKKRGQRKTAEKLKCAECGRMIAASRMNFHMLKKHNRLN